MQQTDFVFTMAIDKAKKKTESRLKQQNQVYIYNNTFNPPVPS